MIGTFIRSREVCKAFRAITMPQNYFVENSEEDSSLVLSKYVLVVSYGHTGEEVPYAGGIRFPLSSGSLVPLCLFQYTDDHPKYDF